jgi:organic radical activating enzyme
VIKILYPLRESFLDYPDNKSSCLSLFMVGCDHNCEGCHNKELQNFDCNIDSVVKLNTKEVLDLILNSFEDYSTNKLAILGGEPLHPNNIHITKQILKEFSEILDICIYTGYSVDYIKQTGISGFKFLKTGKYIKGLGQHSEKTDDYFQLSSTNQVIYNSDFRAISKNGKLKFN